MIRPKLKHIDQMLQQTFREEAEKIAPPPSDKLWAELQIRLEPHKIPEMEERAGSLLAKETTAEKKFDSYSFWKRHRYLAGIAAACFLMILVTASTIPSSGMKHFLTEIFTFTQGDRGNMEVGISSDTAGEAELMQSEDQAFLRGLSLECQEEGLLLSSPPPNKEMETSIKGAGEDAPMQMESSDVLFHSDETILFTEEETFFSSLKKLKAYSPDEIWQIKTPDGFIFKNAEIIKTEDSLVNVFQEYESDEGQSLTLVQEFFHNRIDINSAITTSDSLTHPIQVGQYKGHLLRQPYGSHMVIWVQENSRVTLWGQLSEEELFEVLYALEK